MVPDAGAPVVELNEYAPDGVGEVDGLLFDWHLSHTSQSGSHTALKNDLNS